MKARYLFLTVAVLLGVLFVSITAEAQVSTGLDNLIAKHFAPLKGKRVGLITNQTSRTRTAEFGPQVLVQQKVFKLVSLYSPEHGLMGKRPAGVTSDEQEFFEGIPVYSLYGSGRKPTKDILKGINALVFDIQDVGVRPYTYLSTMVLAMEAAAENKIPFYVLDRPNPLSGARVEGNVLDPSLKSFVGQVPVPYLHGMTLGELAKMSKAKNWFNSAAKLKLTVIPMTGWKRSMYWPSTGLAWTAPSPNVPRFENAVGLAMIGATGELGLLSVGVGTDMPFLRIGSNLIKSNDLIRIAKASFPSEITITGADFSATTSAGTKTYNGIRLDLPANLETVPTLYEGQYRMLASMMPDAGFRSAIDQLASSVNTMYQRVTGTYGVLDALKGGGDITPLLMQWRASAETFRKERAPYLLYK